jgi:hypothetical protein
MFFITRLFHNFVYSNVVYIVSELFGSPNDLQKASIYYKVSALSDNVI